MSDVSTWNRILTDEELEDLYLAGFRRTLKSVLGVGDFDRINEALNKELSDCTKIVWFNDQEHWKRFTMKSKEDRSWTIFDECAIRTHEWEGIKRRIIALLPCNTGLMRPDTRLLCDGEAL